VATLTLDTPVQYVKGVGPVRADQLSQLGIITVEDLLSYFPRRFDLRKQAMPIDSLQGDEPAATISGEVQGVKDQPFGKRPHFEVTIDDGTGWAILKWFHGGYLRDQIRPGMQIAASGKVGLYREAIQMINPRHQILWDASGASLDQDEMLPVYPAGGKLSSGIIGSIIQKVLPQAGDLLLEWHPQAFLEPRGLMPRPAAVGAMHRPEDTEQWARARRRLAYDECLLMQLGIALIRLREVSRPAHALNLTATIDQRIRARFPFALTEAQDRVVAEIASDLGRDRPANRLIQGDVGSGKTIVALYAALLAVANRKQVAIMAPTEILANQHFLKVTQYLSGSQVRIERLVGGMPAKERARILDGLATGSIDIIIGTHALISEGVAYKDLALVVVDEQHKFGVRQRTEFRGKGYSPHYLVMTATPIPRTLAMTVFGDLDVSVIDAMPPGRGDIVTQCVAEDELDAVMDAVRARLAVGQQAYFIYPLVNPSPQLELRAAMESYDELREGELADYSIGLIHGQMPADEKNRIMREFEAGTIQVLVASVVVEVGLDVANANVMVIMHAERFGLAQLHQLRGRIGRSEQDALCLLVASPGNPVARQRLDVMVETRDGFKIAEEDLRIRGPGEIFGTRQHGLPELKVADLIEDFDLLRLARRDAFGIVHEDPLLSAPHHQKLRAEVLKLYGERLNLISGA
jgi:ATP-dependent DNA helicase RecG